MPLLTYKRCLKEVLRYALHEGAVGKIGGDGVGLEKSLLSEDGGLLGDRWVWLSSGQELAHA